MECLLACVATGAVTFVVCYMLSKKNVI